MDRVIQDAVCDGEVTGEGARVMVFVPPGHGKSTYCSSWLPTWYLSMWPHRNAIATANTADLAARNGRWVRDNFTDFGDELGTHLRQDSTAVSRWMTDAGGGMSSFGVGSMIPGWRAHLIGIDDPHGGLVEVKSLVQREAVWTWYTGSLRNRLEPGGAIVLLMTRWHEDDLAGRLLKRAAEGGEQWTVVRLPAVAECPEGADPVSWRDEMGRCDGEALWLPRWPARVMREAAITPYNWSALYQQEPHDDDSAMFPRPVLEGAIVDDWPQYQARPIRYWDKAATKHEGPNEFPQTAGVKAALHEGVLYIVDVETAQLDPPGVELLIRTTGARDGHATRVFIEQEPGSGGKDVISHYQRNVLPGYAVEGHLPGANKEVRADPLSSLFRIGNAKIVRGPWNAAYIDELSKFPNAKRKDQVDASSGACAVLAANPQSLLSRIVQAGGLKKPGERTPGGPRVGDADKDQFTGHLRRTMKSEYDDTWGR